MARRRKQKAKPFFLKKKKSVFSRPHPLKRKMVLRQRRMRSFFIKHNPRIYFERGVRKFVGQIYDVSDKVRDKIIESPLALSHPFSAQFYQDRCTLQ